MAPACLSLSIHEQGTPLYYYVFSWLFPQYSTSHMVTSLLRHLWPLEQPEFPLRKKDALGYPREEEKRFHKPELLNDGPLAFFVHLSSCLYLFINPYNHFFPENSLPRSLSPDITCFFWYQNIYLGTDHWHLEYCIYWLISTWIHLQK